MTPGKINLETNDHILLQDGSGVLLLEGVETTLEPHTKLIVAVDYGVYLFAVPDELKSSVTISEAVNPRALIDEVLQRHRSVITEGQNLRALVTENLLAPTIKAPITQTINVVVDERPYLVDIDEAH